MCTNEAELKLRAELVDIKSKEEDAFVKDLAGGTAATWIGLSDSKMEKTWTWKLDNETTYFYKNWNTAPTFDITKVKMRRQFECNISYTFFTF